jgi:hypothetical protein
MVHEQWSSLADEAFESLNSVESHDIVEEIVVDDQK